MCVGAGARENTCKTLKFVFGGWSDAVIDVGHSNEVRAQVAPHFRLCRMITAFLSEAAKKTCFPFGSP